MPTCLGVVTMYDGSTVEVLYGCRRPNDTADVAYAKNSNLS